MFGKKKQVLHVTDSAASSGPIDYDGEREYHAMEQEAAKIVPPPPSPMDPNDPEEIHLNATLGEQTAQRTSAYADHAEARLAQLASQSASQAIVRDNEAAATMQGIGAAIVSAICNKYAEMLEEAEDLEDVEAIIESIKDHGLGHLIENKQ